MATHISAIDRANDAQSDVDNTAKRTHSQSCASQLLSCDALIAEKKLEEAEVLYGVLLEHYPKHNDVRIAYAKFLWSLGRVRHAYNTLKPISSQLPHDSRAEQLWEKISDAYHDFVLPFEERSKQKLRDEEDVRLVAMEKIVEHFETRIIAEPTIGTCPARVAFVTGSLGSGGAERQLSRLSIALTKAHTAEYALCETHIETEIFIKSCDPKSQQDFFLPDLHAANIPVHVMNDATPIAFHKQAGIDPSLHAMLQLMPAQVHYGITRLTPLLSEKPFAAISLWQDGTCLLAAIAALLAGIPCIHLVFRGQPPNIRTSRAKPEYEILYKALAKVPGVVFACNSAVVAKEYAAWLNIPFARFRIIHNAISDVSIESSPAEQALWDAFHARTSDATTTIGGVLRAEPDKRPFSWLKVLHHYIRKHPHSRGILVGGGRLFEETQARAETLGITDRILFVGKSQHVGFWFKKMDVKLLTSRHEGLPNVLIEAQKVGIPVISTPAGGAAECFIEDDTGMVLSDIEITDATEACEKIHTLTTRAKVDPTIATRAKDFADEGFSLTSSMRTFIEMCNS